ncbi:KIN12C, partial [Symbiodinium necroappetens]
MQKVAAGYHATVFAYGQTGSGKTYTMEGYRYRPDAKAAEAGKPQVCVHTTTPERLGVIPRVLQKLFGYVEKLQREVDDNGETFSVSISFLQIYQERIYDLLNPAPVLPQGFGQAEDSGLRLRWDAAGEHFYVENLFVYQCTSAEDALKFYNAGVQRAPVMGAQSAKAKPPRVLNGTIGSYGSMGPMMMDGEIRGPPSVPESQREGASRDVGRAEQGPGVASLRAAAGRVMATVAAKVQGAMPPSGKTGSASSFLGQDDGGSAGTLGSGYVTAGSENLREHPSSSGGQEAAEPGLFSPQQAQRLREMQSEAPLLYAGEENEPRPTSPSPPLPHSTSSGSDQADAIQAEVKRQMQTFMRVQAELQQKVTVLVEENQVLRQDLEAMDDEAYGSRGINLVRASLHLDTQPTTSKVGEYYEHLLVELEAVSRVSEVPPVPTPSAKAEANKSVRQVEAKAQGAGDTTPGAKDPKGFKGGGIPASSDSPKKLCKWFHEGKGCKRGKECRFLHDWNQIPKPDRAERCMACGAKGHRKDVCPNAPAGAVAKRDDGASSAKAAKAEGQAKAKGADPGLKKVLSEAAGVLRDVLSSQSTSTEGNSQVPTDQTRGQASTASGDHLGQGGESPIAAAAKIQAQPESLESRLSDQGPRIRAIHAGTLSQEEPTALLDSGATHAVLDSSSVRSTDLIPCTVSLAGDQKQVWHQTPGGSLVAPENKEGSVSQTILPLGCLIEQLGCTVRWSHKSGLHLIHPRLGRLKTSLKSGCPQLGKEQALQLVKELEGARLQELSGRLRRVQAQLKVAGGMRFEEALDAFVTKGSYGTALAFARFMPFLSDVPERVTNRLVVDLQDAVGWEALKGLPFNRATRKKLHQSHAWLLHLGTNKVDPTLRQLCKAQHLELVELDNTLGGTLESGVWKALSWAAFTGRVAGILCDAPMRTWNSVKVNGTSCVQLRSQEHLWGEPSNSDGMQTRVDDDTVLGLQPMWLWTLASLARGEGVPFCQTHVLQGESRSSPWLGAVVNPFAEWSNSTKFEVPGVHEGIRQTKPFQVCTNLGFPSTGVRSLSGRSRTDDVPVDPEWPTAFKSELSLALFGLAASRQAEEEPTSVKVVEAADAYLLSDPTRPAGPVSFKPPVPEVQAVDGELLRESDEVPVPPPRAEEECLDQCVDSSAGACVQASSSATGAKEGTKAKKGSVAARMTEAERERWRKHIAAHHIPFRKDCIQCVMSGSLGLQHRRVKCPTMYALAFDLAGPFKELGRDDRGGKYKYVLVAGLRVPDAALPSPRHDKGAPASEPQPPEAQAEVCGGLEQDDDAASEASWLREQLEPTPVVKKVGEDDSSSQEEDEGSQVGWYEAPFVDEAECSGVEAAVEADDEPGVEGGVGLDVDPWEDVGGFGEMTDEKFDEALSEMLFSGANKVLRFAVPLKARKGPLILAGLQEIVTECNRLGYPVKVVHTDRAKELMSKATMDWLQSNLIQPSFTQGDDPKSNGLAERLVGWVKARARLHLASSGLGLEQWPSAMAFACAEHRGRLLQTGERLPRFGQKVIFKSKHPTGKSKRPFLRWEHAVYLCPTPRTEGGHVLLRAASSAYLVAKNVRCVEEMVDPEAEFGAEQVVEVDPPEPGFEHTQGVSPGVPSRRVTGKRAARSVKLAAEDYAETLLEGLLFSSDHCGRLLQLAFEGVGGGTRREHRGPIGFSVIFGAYSHGGLQGITRASRMYPMVCRYLNEYLCQCSPNQLAANEWSSLMVIVADEVAMHRDVRNEPGSLNHVTQLTTRLMWVEGTSPVLTELEQQDGKRRTHKGYLLPLTQATTVFDPKCRHAVLPATNWVIAGYTPLGYQKLSAFKQHQLIELGLRLPSLDRPPAVCKLVGPCPTRLPGIRARPYPPPPGRAAMMVRYARMTGDEWAELCQLEEEEFERRMGRWQRVLGGQDEDPNMNALSASIPHHLFMQTVFRQRNWNRNPEVLVPGAEGEPRLLARVLDFADDGPTEESPFPDRMLMFSVHDVIRDVVEMVILRVEARRPPQEEQRQEEIGPILQPPGPPPPEVRAVKLEVGRCNPPAGPSRLPVHLPNPAFIKVVPVQPAPVPEPEAYACKTEATTTKDLETVLGRLQEPLSVTHTASQEEVRSNLEKWRSAIEKELGSLKKQGVLISHRGQEAKELMANTDTTVISLKGVFAAKAPSGPEDGLFKRKCRLVGCGNQATHVDADSLYAAGAPAEAVRVALTQAYHHQWAAFTTDIKSAFTQTPIPAHAAQRYLLRPPRWLIDLGLAEPGEYYSLGMVLYGFKEAPAWWSDHRDAKLRKAVFAECHLEQGTADSSVWRILKGTVLKGYLVTYVDDFLVLSERTTAHALHQWLLSEAGWETDGLSEARPGHPVRFLGMQLQGHEDGHFSLDQEAYVDELIRAYKLSEANRSKIVCPKEILMHAPETVQPFDDQTVKSAQKLAGECLWLAQRSRIDIAFATTVLCSKVSKDPHGAIAIGQRMMSYLHHTKDFKLHLKPTEGVAPLRVFTDASFAGAAFLRWAHHRSVWCSGALEGIQTTFDFSEFFR